MCMLKIKYFKIQFSSYIFLNPFFLMYIFEYVVCVCTVKMFQMLPLKVWLQRSLKLSEIEF